MKIIRQIERLLKNPYYLSKTRYLKYVENHKIDENLILLECQQGKNIKGNIFYILKELINHPDYQKFNVLLSVDKEKHLEINNFLKMNQLNVITIVYTNTKNYYKAMATAKYLINDTSFPSCFIKRKEQIYLNTWHGTPLKTLGKKVNNDFHNIGNVMKNFIVSDYLLFPNEFTRNHMIEDYMLENLSHAKVVLNGYPRNSIFFNQTSRENIYNKYLTDHTKNVAYMPTWRGSVANKEIDSQIEIITKQLDYLENQLDEQVHLYVNLHPFLDESIDFSKYRKIQSFPKEVETYEFLNACDILVTDYSSVFFDFAITNKKIILFTYDLEEYLETRGMYLSLRDLPFAHVNELSDLITEINSPLQENTDNFRKEYCSYDSVDASKKLLDLFLFNKNKELVVHDINHNGKENILIYGGNLAKNGITTSLLNLFNAIDTDKYNYYLTFTSARISSHKNVLKLLPKNISYIPVTGVMNASLFEKIGLAVMRRYPYSFDFSRKGFDRLYKNEIKRSYGDIRFSHVIQFNGYEMKRLLMFGRFDCKRSVFVHSNMIQEVNVKRNQNANVLRYAYNHYDHVAIVSEDMREPTKHYCFDESKICVVNNVIDYKKVQRYSKKELHFDESTESNKTLKEIKEIFQEENHRFITIGRFSAEKGHLRLMQAFHKIWKWNPNVYLFIIGGYGPLYKETLDVANSLESGSNIIIIKSLTNPYTFLKQCHFFVFSSFYEAFGLTIAEADILGKPVISTDILGPRGFMKEYGGTLVDNNEDGIYFGMKDLLSGKIQPMNIDYSLYNKQAIDQFNRLIEM